MVNGAPDPAFDDGGRGEGATGRGLLFMFRYHRRKLTIVATAISVVAAGVSATLSHAAAASAAGLPTPPFNECPAIASSPSCEILLVVNPDKTISVIGDPSVGPFDGSDDTLVGIINNSAAPVQAITVSGPGSDLSGFDGDGICSGDYGTWNGSSGCPYGPTGYEGPGTSFVTSSALPDDAEVDFSGGLAPGASAYFSLEGALVSAQLAAREGGLGFTVTGSIPVAPNSGQDTHAQNPSAVCDPTTFRKDEAIGQALVADYENANLPVSALLLGHFLSGTGSEIDFAAGSQISKEAAQSGPFKSVNKSVQADVLNQLESGVSQIQVANPPLRTVNFNLLHSSRDLYFGFRGTQGIDVSGNIWITGGNYVGTLTYVIRDSYGFTTGDVLLGLGTRMRYLQTNCGNPPTAGGAHWFPDTITVTVPFKHPVGS